MTKINSDIFSFFKELDQNNNRVWFEANKKRFKSLEAEMKFFSAQLETEMNTFDRIEKTKIFRIYRDVRFSKDKTPYKRHFGVSFHREKPALRGGYYLHIKPGDSFLGTGFWNPSKEDLFRIRKELEVDATEFRAVIADSKLTKSWRKLTGDVLKVAPKGFEKEHKDIDLLRQKQYLFLHKYTDSEVLSDGFLKDVAQRFNAIRPFFDLMSGVLTTDLNGVSLLED
jgi:uncharacterized protein (TIGR02453 family)